MNEKKSLLMLCTEFPFPIHRGDQLIVFNYMTFLKERYNITLITFGKDNISQDNIQVVSEQCERLIIIRRSKIESVLNLLFCLFKQTPLQVAFFKSRRYQKEVDKLLNSDEIDYVLPFTIRVAPYVLKFKKVKTLFLIDSMYLNIYRRALNESFFKRIVFLYEARLVKRFEKNILKYFDNGIVVSAIDKEIIGKKNVFVLPNGVNCPNIEKDRERNNTIVFSGNLSYFPNQNAIKWFLENCFEDLKNKIPDLKFVIVGKKAPKSIELLHDNIHVIVKGFVPDIFEEIGKATIAIAPMQSGSGMQNKILEAMSCKVPVVTNDIGKGDIQAKNDVDIIVANTKEAFVERCFELLKDKKLSEVIGNNGYEFIQKNHNWENNSWELISLIEFPN